MPVRFFGGETMVWSHLRWRELLTGYEAVYVEGNPRYLAFALLATLRRLLGKPVVLWTMVHSFRNHAGRQNLRLAWTRLFQRVLVYTEAEAATLRERGFAPERVVSINNGLDQERIAQAAAGWTPERLQAWRSEQGLAGHRILLSCARLEPKNKFAQVLAALPGLIERHPHLVWCVIGEGQQGSLLREEVARRGLEAHVRWIGALHDEAALAPWFLSADALVHPGAIGLTILHAFGYGLPVVTHSSRETHCPEIVAFSEGETGRTFREDDLADLEQTLAGLLADPSQRERMSRHCRDVAEHRYNTRVMSERFMQCLD
jgi:glycosyltransferase involved in cell wall biosynthesis